MTKADKAPKLQGMVAAGTKIVLYPPTLTYIAVFRAADGTKAARHKVAREAMALEELRRLPSYYHDEVKMIDLSDRANKRYRALADAAEGMAIIEVLKLGADDLNNHPQAYISAAERLVALQRLYHLHFERGTHNPVMAALRSDPCEPATPTHRDVARTGYRNTAVGSGPEDY